MDAKLIIAKDDIRVAYKDKNNNYYFRYLESDVIQQSTEEEVKEWCKQFKREDVMDHIAEIFCDDPDFQITTISFHVPGWMREEFLNYRDRNSLTTDSAFYRLWNDEKDYTNRLIGDNQNKYWGRYTAPFFMRGITWKRNIILIMLDRLNRIQK